MSMLSAGFFLFLAAAIIGYYTVARRFQRFWLLIFSLFFYACSDPRALFFLLFCALSTFAAAKAVSGSRTENSRKAALVLGIGLNILLLLFIKLYNYYGQMLFRFLHTAGDFSREFHALNLIVPLGISYYTLQAVSYVADVYRNRIQAETDFFTYLLYLSYFPLITQGPIARYDQMKDQLTARHDFSYRQVAHGAQLCLWGLFKKLVIADRLGIAVSDIFLNPRCGSVALFGSVLFSVQLYADFSGCMDLVGGCSEMFGITLPANFLFPFSARSVKDFWRRWHVSLSTWLRDYIYFPLGGNRKGKGRKYVNLLITFLVSGIWHGGTLGYLAWGLLHGLYQIAGDLTAPAREKIRKRLGFDPDTDGYHFMESAVTLLLVSAAWIFFRADGLAAGLRMMKLIFTDFQLPLLIRNLYSFGLNETCTWFLTAAAAVMFFVEHLHKTVAVRDYIDRQPLPVRWLIYLSGLAVVVVMGKYGMDGTDMFRYAYF